MSNLVYPTLPGQALAIEREPIWKEDVQETNGGQEIRSTYWTYPKWRYTLAYDWLIAGGTKRELDTLHGFLARHAGRTDSFLFKDPDDNALTAHPFGVGDGATLAFQLQRTQVSSGDLAGAASRAYWPNYTDGYEPVFEFEGTPTIYVAGVLTAPASIGSTGLVTFSGAPANGAALTWSGVFYRRVRFDDSIPANRVLPTFYKAKKVVLVSVKP